MTVNWVAYDRRIDRPCAPGYIRNPYSNRCVSVVGATYKAMLNRLKMDGHHQQAENLGAGRRPKMQRNSMSENDTSLRQIIDTYQREIYALKSQLQQRSLHDATRELKNARLEQLENYVQELETQRALDASKIADDTTLRQIETNRNRLKANKNTDVALITQLRANIARVEAEKPVHNARLKKLENYVQELETQRALDASKIADSILLTKNRNALQRRVENTTELLHQMHTKITSIEANRNTQAATVAQLRDNITRLEAEKNALKTNSTATNASKKRIQQLEKQQEVLTRYLKTIVSGNTPSRTNALYFHPNKPTGSKDLFQALTSMQKKLLSVGPESSTFDQARMTEMGVALETTERELKTKQRELENAQRKSKLEIERIQRDANSRVSSTAASRKVTQLTGEINRMQAALESAQREVETLSRRAPITRQYTDIQQQLQQREAELYAAQAQLEAFTQVRREKEELERIVAESRTQINAARAEVQAVSTTQTQNKGQFERKLQELQRIIDQHKTNADAAHRALEDNREYTDRMMANHTQMQMIKIERLTAQHEAKIAELANALAAANARAAAAATNARDAQAAISKAKANAQVAVNAAANAEAARRRSAQLAGTKRKRRRRNTNERVEKKLRKATNMNTALGITEARVAAQAVEHAAKAAKAAVEKVRRSERIRARS